MLFRSGKLGADGSEALVRCCERPNPDTLLLVTMPRPEGPFWKAPWYTAFSEAGVVVEVLPVERARLPDWIRARLARNGQSVDAEAMEYLVDRVEGNLLAAHQEIVKLGLLYGEGELTMKELASAIAKKTKDYSKIDGLIWRGTDNKSVVVNKPRVPIEIY